MVELSSRVSAVGSPDTFWEVQGGGVGVVANLAASSLLGLPLTALQVSHPRMIFEVDLAGV